MHVSYIIYMSSYSAAISKTYFKTALSFCSMTKTPPSLLLHPLDFLGADDIPELRFFPGMNMESKRKLEIVSDVLAMMTKKFDVVNMRHHAEIVEAEKDLRLRDANVLRSATQDSLTAA